MILDLPSNHRVFFIISTNKCTRTSLSLFSLLKECPNTHFGNYIAIIRVFLSEMLHTLILKLRHNSESIYVITTDCYDVT
jgi:hypothetical protein